MLDRDDDGYNSPEGNGISEEGQRRKAALAQLTVDVDGDGGGCTRRKFSIPSLVAYL